MENSQRKTKFHDDLKKLMDELVFLVYRTTKTFPKDEIYGVTSQIRRSSLSVILNYIEGFARQTKPTLKNFLEISYGSLKETRYLIYFSFKQGYLNKDDYERGIFLSDEIGKMLWGILRRL
ncbi:four helix bundle protein [Candidatus Roizmanbacteria bacterium]|nr:four helix bundle protein [Candidatus Roizmanbacteria bacterium]